MAAIPRSCNAMMTPNQISAWRIIGPPRKLVRSRAGCSGARKSCRCRQSRQARRQELPPLQAKQMRALWAMGAMNIDRRVAGGQKKFVGTPQGRGEKHKANQRGQMAGEGRQT